MGRILITGVAGFIGMHAAIRFLDEGWDVVGLDNINDYYDVQLKFDRLNEIGLRAERSNGDFRFHKSDLNSSVWVELEGEKFDTCLHLAAQAGVRYSLENPEAYIMSNILGFQKVLDFVKSAGIKRFLYASSSSVYGSRTDKPFGESLNCSKPESYYAATKIANELMAFSYHRTHGIQSIGLRFFTVYGPWGRPDMAPMLFASAASKNQSIKVYNYGNQRRDFTYIEDIIEGIYSLVIMNKFPAGAEVFNIGNGSPVGLMDFISEIEVNMKIELSKEFVEAQLGDVEETFADTTKLFNLTGYKPRTSLETGIEKFINWYKVYYKL